MRRKHATSALGVSLVLTSLLMATHSLAGVSVYTSLAAFQAAAPQALLATNLESKAVGATGNFTLGGLSFSSTLNNMYIISGGAPGETVPIPTSKMLSANGQEDIFIAVNAGWTPSIGFTLLTNQYGPHTATLYDESGTAFYTYLTTQAPNSIGFLGFVSTTGIHEVHWVADRGNLQNTALDNFYFNASDITPTRSGTWGRMKTLYH